MTPRELAREFVAAVKDRIGEQVAAEFERYLEERARTQTAQDGPGSDDLPSNEKSCDGWGDRAADATPAAPPGTLEECRQALLPFGQAYGDYLRTLSGPPQAPASELIERPGNLPRPVGQHQTPDPSPREYRGYVVAYRPVVPGLCTLYLPAALTGVFAAFPSAARVSVHLGGAVRAWKTYRPARPDGSDKYRPGEIRAPEYHAVRRAWRTRDLTDTETRGAGL